MNAPAPAEPAAPVFKKVVVAAVTAALVPLLVRYGNDLLGAPIDTETATRWAVAAATAVFTFGAGFFTPERLSTVRAYVRSKEQQGTPMGQVTLDHSDDEGLRERVDRTRGQEPGRDDPPSTSWRDRAAAARQEHGDPPPTTFRREQR